MSADRWVFAQDDGTIILREENDGWQYLCHGPSVGRRQGGSRGGISLGLPHAGRRLSPVGFSRIGPNGSYSRDGLRSSVFDSGQPAHLLIGP